MDDSQKKFLGQIAVFILALSFIYFFCITFIPMPETGVRYADIILGALLGSGFTVIVAFYFGSSKSSADKTEAMHGLAKRKSDKEVLLDNEDLPKDKEEICGQS